jgi:hypothetical protein
MKRVWPPVCWFPVPKPDVRAGTLPIYGLCRIGFRPLIGLIASLRTTTHPSWINRAKQSPGSGWPPIKGSVAIPSEAIPQGRRPPTLAGRERKGNLCLEKT